MIKCFTKKDFTLSAKDCPGMNNGRLWTFEEIEKNKIAYRSNVPLKKEEVEKLIQKEETDRQNLIANAPTPDGSGA